MKIVKLLALNFLLLSGLSANAYMPMDLFNMYNHYLPKKILTYIQPIFTRANEYLPYYLSLCRALNDHPESFSLSSCFACTTCNYCYPLQKQFIFEVFYDSMKKVETHENSPDIPKILTEKILTIIPLPEQELLPELLQITTVYNFICARCSSNTWKIAPLDTAIVLNSSEFKKNPFTYCSQPVFVTLCVLALYERLNKQLIRYKKRHPDSLRIICSSCKQCSYSCYDFTDELLLALMKKIQTNEPLLEILTTTFKDITTAFSKVPTKLPQRLIHIACKTNLTCSNCQQQAWQGIKN